ncbi:MAG TPA: helix-turn-helix domain-containing protein [Rhodocyclaceae bacterium]|nr:helix-turn-helix domain-containing protein [Rhodocyclaceae bacterium]
MKQDNTTISPLIGKAELCERLRVSQRTIENMVRDGEFPPPVRIGKHVYWSETTVRTWQRRLFCAQESWTSI